MTMGYSSDGYLGLCLLTISMLILGSSSSRTTPYTFHVGGKDGWVINPSEDYSHWAQRNRFQVNDTLYFKYKKGSDSVLVVKKEDYDSCNTKNPIRKMDDCDSTFTLDKSGPFFFISGNVGNCQHGQKLIVVVLAVRHKPSQSPSQAAPPSLAPSPAEAEEPSTADAEPPQANGPSASSSLGPSSPSPTVASPPKHSGSTRFRGSVSVALGVSIGVGLLFSILG